MAKEGPDWEGLLKWSIKHTDGTKPTCELSEEEKKWFMEAVKNNSFDPVARMREITQLLSIPKEELDRQGVQPSDMEGVLEELQELVERIDMANDLHKVGGLIPLLGYLQNCEARLRSRAAEVVSTIVQNNPESQKIVLDNKGMEILMGNLQNDVNPTSRTKALGAISSLIRHNKLGLNAFNLSNGLGALKGAMQSDHVPLQRKALQLLRYVLAETPGQSTAGSELNLTRTLTKFVEHPNADVREAALAALAEIASQSEGEASICSQDPQLKDTLRKRLEELSTLKGQDRAAARDELSLIELLWSKCFSEPSPSRALVAKSEPADDDPDEEVKVIKDRERKPYSYAETSRGSSGDGNEGTEKKTDPPLLLGGGPS